MISVRGKKKRLITYGTTNKDMWNACVWYCWQRLIANLVSKVSYWYNVLPDASWRQISQPEAACTPELDPCSEGPCIEAPLQPFSCTSSLISQKQTLSAVKKEKNIREQSNNIKQVFYKTMLLYRFSWQQQNLQLLTRKQRWIPGEAAKALTFLKQQCTKIMYSVFSRNRTF